MSCILYLDSASVTGFLTPWARSLWSSLVHFSFWKLSLLNLDLMRIWFVARTAIFSSIYPGFPSRLQLMTMNKLPRVWWKLFSSERSTHVLPTIASREQHLSTCAACGIRNGRLKMRCAQVNILLKIFNCILKNLNIILKYRIKPKLCCSKGKLYFCHDLFWLSL